MKPYPAYKPSGVPWLGKMPAHWESKAAKFLVTCNDDVLTEDVDPATEIVYVEIADVEEGQGIKATTDMLFKDAPSRARRQVKHGDIIVSTVRTYLKAIAPVENPPDNLVVSTGFAVLRPHGVSQGFAKYAFAESGFINTVIARSNGVSYPAINATDLVRIPIPVPPVEEQQVIASYLDRETARVDTLIAEKGRLIETLREYRQATISEVVTQGLDSAAPKKPSGVPWLGGVPASWSVLRVKEVATVLPSNIDKLTVEGEQPVSLCNYVDVYKNDKITADIEFMPATATDEQIRKLSLTKGDVVLTKDSESPWDIAVPTYIAEDIPNLACGYHLAKLAPNEYLIRGDFLCWSLKAFPVSVHFSLAASGITRYGLSIANISDGNIPVPSLTEQQAIASYLDTETTRIDKLLAHVQDEIKLLQELRAATITDAVTGKIQVG